MARNLSAKSEAAAHAKTLTGALEGGRWPEGVMAETRKLPFFIRGAPLDIRWRSCEATRRGEKDCCGSQALSHIRGCRSYKETHRREADGRGSQPPSLYPTGAARHPPAVM